MLGRRSIRCASLATVLQARLQRLSDQDGSQGSSRKDVVGNYPFALELLQGFALKKVGYANSRRACLCRLDFVLLLH